MILLLVVKITGGKSDMTQDTHTACSSMLYIPHMTQSEDSYPGVQLCAPSNSHTHCWYKHRTNGQMSTNQHMGLQTDPWTRGVSRHLNAPQVSQPIDPSRGHLRALKTIPPFHILFSPPTSLLPSVLTLAFVQTTNQTDGFVFDSSPPSFCLPLLFPPSNHILLQCG